MYPNKILAVVVTYNRLELLKRCIKGLQSQTLKDFDILIVNNGSTDGTKEWIDSLSKEILRIHQGNLGGAGGFYAGQKYGYDNGYEWIWMMDDDGVPDSNQLSELLKVAERYDKKNNRSLGSEYRQARRGSFLSSFIVGHTGYGIFGEHAICMSV